VARKVIRQRLLTIILLGVLTAALSLVALIGALSAMSRTLRMERAREAVPEEAHRLADGPPTPEALAAPLPTGHVGMRAGWLTAAGDVDRLTGVPDAWRSPLAGAVAAARTGAALSEVELGRSSLVVAAAPARAGGFAWTAYVVQPAVLDPLRYTIFGLAAATALLVATTVWVAFSFRRSTAALHRTLVSLGTDLSAPVPEPSIAELSGIAQGIRRLANDLQRSREATDGLSRELAQKERLAALGRVAAGVAHEVRNPLASIKLRLDLTASSPALAEPVRTAVRAASEEIARLDRLVADLLLVAGQKVGPRRPVELGELVRARALALQPWSAERRVELRVDGKGVADADPESVARAVDNVIRNAVEASPPGGQVRARVLATGAEVEVRVEDRGAGVPPARTDELFEPFFTTKADGTGLGLAISRAIARAHGGDLRYRRVGDVTQFSLTLPEEQ